MEQRMTLWANCATERPSILRNSGNAFISENMPLLLKFERIIVRDFFFLRLP